MVAARRGRPRSEPLRDATNGATSDVAQREGSASRRHLASRLRHVEERVRAATARRRAAGDPATDPWPGLFVSDEKAERLLAVGSPLSDTSDTSDTSGAAGTSGTSGTARAVGVFGVDTASGSYAAALGDGWGALLEKIEAAADDAELAGERLRLRVLQRRFGIDDRSLDVLVVALAPELDRRFEQLYGYLNDDITRRHATVGLALELVGVPLWSPLSRGILGSGSALVRAGLLTLEGNDRPWPGRELRVADRVVEWCLGRDEPDAQVAEVAEVVPLGALEEADGGAARDGGGETEGDAEGVVAAAQARALAKWLKETGGLVYLREGPGASGRWLGSTTWLAAGSPALVCQLERLGSGGDGVVVAAAVAREAALQEAGLVAGPIDALGGNPARVVEALTTGLAGVILHGRGPWDASWSRSTPLVLSVALPSSEELASHWARALVGAPLAPGLEALAATSQFRLSPEQVHRAAGVARARAALLDSTIDAEELRAGAREHNNPGLERLAQRIEPAVGWSDLVLPDSIALHLREVTARARHRDTVLGLWGMRPGGRRGRGVVALFCGVSGTGKTMSAEVLAGELGIDLYVVDLASVVDKYVGETEKNLERIFTEADGVGGVILFDEADALFAKRSDVRGANDRYANVEVAYLLQRMERFDGLALLSTNLRANIDEAFVRRLDAVVEFPMPDASLRRTLWERSLTPAVPRGDDLDLDFLAASFPLSGGNIHSVALSAAYLAAESGLPVTMSDVVRCLAREYRKLGRLCTEAEFGRYWPILAN